ncbi:hypothetical protein C8J57DRAFT_1258715 [Mycena rebaudengoi]|nr:hypothetical protein C8J57DRAFT_1258715 [Mycena rebaudengoi]
MLPSDAVLVSGILTRPVVPPIFRHKPGDDLYPSSQGIQWWPVTRPSPTTGRAAERSCFSRGYHRRTLLLAGAVVNRRDANSSSNFLEVMKYPLAPDRPSRCIPMRLSSRCCIVFLIPAGLFFAFACSYFWLHDIYVDSILLPAESDGKVSLLAGSGACPREDGQGHRNWTEFINSLDSEKHAQITCSTNYEADPEVRRLGSRWRFDPLAFDLTTARKRITDALASPPSVPSGPKKAAFGDPTPMTRHPAPKGTHQAVTPAGFAYDPPECSRRRLFVTRGIRSRLHSARAIANLCKLRRFVPPAGSCQTAHWKEHKQICVRPTT